MTIVRPGTPRTRFRTSRRYLGPLFFDKKSISITVPISVPILNRFCADLGCPLDPKILQNYVRGVRNQTLRIYTLDVDPMSFRMDFGHPKWSQNGFKIAPRRCAVDPSMVAEPIFEGRSPQRWFYPLRYRFGTDFCWVWAQF